MNNSSRLIYLFPIISTITWGLSIVVAKIVEESGFSPIEIVFGRFALSSIIFLPILWYHSKAGNRIRPVGNEWRPIFGLAVTGVAINNTIFYFGLAHTDASIASIIVSFTPLSTMIFATIMLKNETITKRRIISVGIGILGVVFIIGFTENNGTIFGNIFVLLAIAMWGSSFSFSKMSSNSGFSSITITGLSIIVGTVLILPVILYNGSLSKYFALSITSKVMFLFIFLALFAGVISYILHYKAVEVFGAGKVAPTTNIIPFSGVFFSWLLLNSEITGQPLIGLFLILLGVLIVQTENTST